MLGAGGLPKGRCDIVPTCRTNVSAERYETNKIRCGCRHSPDRCCGRGVAASQLRGRRRLEVVGWFGGHGGHGTGQFFHIHNLAVDSKGNIYLGESFGQRVMRWWYKGM
jgi:hypothetical protein